MKRSHLTLTLCFCAGLALADESSASFNVSAPKCKEVKLSGQNGALPGVNSFFDTIAITVMPGQKRQFLVGDNIAGYFEGYTHDYHHGGGYLMKDTTLFAGYATFADGTLNNRDAGDSVESVLPRGNRVDYHDGISEEMVVHSGKYAVSIAEHSSKPQILGVIPFLLCPLDSVEIRQIGQAVVISPKAAMTNSPYPTFIALCADKNFTLSTVLKDAPTEASKALKFSDRDLVVYVASRKAVNNITVTIAFGFTAEEAAKKAAAIAASDPVNAELQACYDYLTKSYLWTDDDEYNKALMWAKSASHLFVVEEFGKGIWAGLPWFKNNWGRDTFISLPGTLLVSGSFDEAREVLENFARFQNLHPDRNYGRIPNRVSSLENVIYNTTDGTPWMIREAYEYMRYTGDQDFARKFYPVVKTALDGAITNHVDTEGFLKHDDADTWMDARITGDKPWSARGNRAVEIQALWFTALEAGVALANANGDDTAAGKWQRQAEILKSNFTGKFWDGRVMADRLRADGTRDVKVRPNQLMTVSVPFDDRLTAGDVEALVTKNAVSELLYPYGIASLSQNDPYFHPVHHDDKYFFFDAAYHNGTVWGWNAGFTVTALDRFGYQDLAYQLAKNLSDQILNLGTVGNMSELLDALPDVNGKIHTSGTFAQAWSVAEFARNGYQDFLGFCPNLLENSLVFMPAIPSAWKHLDAILPFGQREQLHVAWTRIGGGEQWTFNLNGSTYRKGEMRFLTLDKSRRSLIFNLAPGRINVVVIKDNEAWINGKSVATSPFLPSYASLIGNLQFQTPKIFDPANPEEFPVLRGKDILQGIIERGEYK
jgi:glycogen debranching enzyme